jgi:hypothetical protein
MTRFEKLMIAFIVMQGVSIVLTVCTLIVFVTK